MQTLGYIGIFILICLMPFAGIYTLYVGIKNLKKLKDEVPPVSVEGKVYRVTSLHNGYTAHVEYIYCGEIRRTQVPTNNAKHGGLKVGDTYTVKVFEDEGDVYTGHGITIVGLCISVILIAGGIYGIVKVIIPQLIALTK